MNKTVTYLSLVATILLVITLMITFLYPEIIRSLLLSVTEARVIIVTLISFILLLAFLQTQLSWTWRIASLVASFLTLLESVLMLGTWESIFLIK